MWDDEAEFVRLEGSFFQQRSYPRKTRQRRTGLLWVLPGVCPLRLEQ
jgi:hypothetical protein